MNKNKFVINSFQTWANWVSCINFRVHVYLVPWCPLVSFWTTMIWYYLNKQNVITLLYERDRKNKYKLYMYFHTSWGVIYIDCTVPMVQGARLHSCFSWNRPTQLLPPNWGEGLLHARIDTNVPLPHVTLQERFWNSLQPPSAKKLYESILKQVWVYIFFAISR